MTALDCIDRMKWKYSCLSWKSVKTTQEMLVSRNDMKRKDTFIFHKNMCQRDPFIDGLVQERRNSSALASIFTYGNKMQLHV